MVSGRQVWHLGALGGAGRAEEGDWYARKMYQQGTPDYKDHLRALRPSVHEWLEGHHPAVESREVGTGKADGTL